MGLRMGSFCTLAWTRYVRPVTLGVTHPIVGEAILLLVVGTGVGFPLYEAEASEAAEPHRSVLTLSAWQKRKREFRE